MIKNIIFDLIGVLTTPGKILAVRRAHEVGMTGEVVDKIINGSEMKLHKVGAIDSETYWRKIYENYDIPVPKERLRAWFLSLHKKYPKMFDFVDELRKQGYKLVLLSNNIPERAEYLEDKFKISEHFDHVFYSHEVGFAKPSSNYYKEVIKRAKINPRESVFIDDKPSNLIPARRLGFKCVQFKNYDQCVIEVRKFL